jgi:protein-S-isoprenylcysteine O-methyltransferase Ste14
MDSARGAALGRAMRHLDLPPVWLLAHAVLALLLARVEPAGWGFGLLSPWLGVVLLLGGIGLILAAVAQMRRFRTAVMPRRDASRLLSTGLFARSRNPIYLGMALILLGLGVVLDAPLALLAVPAFVLLIQVRFIRGEEASLARLFGPDFERYRATTRPWL